MLTKVWIAYQDSGSEGCSVPLQAFGSKDLADIWVMGANDTYGSGACIIEMDVHLSPSLKELIAKAESSSVGPNIQNGRIQP